MGRKAFNTTIDEDLFRELKLLAAKTDVRINELIEKGIRMVLDQEKNDKEPSNE
ncbi:ribbon-helix-helix domain-containing protein [Ammoniphilus resinae]|uniref:HicB family RNase H-like nuclease n=1 Tax=Ammoniphilus resinae TaxID=861532 RepID=A0ABS4GXP8_9BACL|nr:ribbon-helix-helix domain-containing protein [Ammoniphilus resinae]MBP1935038.1 putative HicB family RNase H-like nuclease [Ammoniphilus resinae]